MTISDPRFGGEILTNKGKIYKFDDMHCLLSYLKSGEISSKDIKNVYLVNFVADHNFIRSQEALLLKSDELKSPMNGNVAAFANADSLKKTLAFFKGIQVDWKQLSEQ